MKKILVIVYFVVLFFILGSYFKYANPDLSLRLMATASIYQSPDQHNIMMVQVDNAHPNVAMGNTKMSMWWQRYNNVFLQDMISDSVMNVLPQNGRTYFYIPIPKTKDDTPSKKDPAKKILDDLINESIAEAINNGELDPEIAKFVKKEVRIQLDNGELTVPDLDLSYPDSDSATNNNSGKKDNMSGILGRKDHLTGKQSLLIRWYNEGDDQQYVQFEADGFIREKIEPVPLPQNLYNDDVSPNLVSIAAPSAFMLGEPNEVLFADIKDGVPYTGNIVVEQINVFPALPSQNIPADPSGVTSIPLSINAQADFKITAGGDDFYATFVPLEKSFHITIDDYSITPKKKPHIHIVPAGSPQQMFVDYFVGRAWIGHEVIPANQIHDFELSPDLIFTSRDQLIVYARISTSEFATEESSQTIALYATNNPNHTVADSFDLILREFTSNARQNNDSSDNTTGAIASLVHLIASQEYTKNAFSHYIQLQKYFLNRLAGEHHPETKLLFRSDEQAIAQFEADKKNHHKTMNILLIIWFVIGVIVFIGVAIHIRNKNVLAWEEAAASGSTDYIPSGTPAWLVILIAALIFGLLISLYYMMQLI
jgi:hypothetical protein